MWLRRNRFERELTEEMQSHLAEREAAYVRDGLSPADARRRARLDFGNPAVIREQSRDVWLVRWADTIARDARIALRMLRRAPGFTFAAVATLALGIGAGTAIFTLVDALLLRPLPYPAPDRLVRIAPGFPMGALPILREHGRPFAAVGGYAPGVEVTWTGGPEPLRLTAAIVSGDLFDVLGSPAAKGRTTMQADERPGAERIVLISEGFHRTHFAGADAAIGQTLTINDERLRIAGVMPAAFRFPDVSTDLWIPARVDPANGIANWTSVGMQFVGRLAPGVTPASAQADVPRLAGLIRDGFPWAMPRDFGLSTEIVPLQESTVAAIRDGFVLLSAAVALVMLIACANVATLLLSRAEARVREMAVRGALGAGRRRLAVQLLLESAIIALIGTAAALALLAAGLPALTAFLPDAVPRVRDLAIDMRVLAFATGGALLTSMLIGGMPALRAARPDLAAALRTGDARSGRRSRMFNVLVAAEVALALMLVAGAAVLLRSLANLTAVHPGFEAAGLASARIHPIETRYATPEARIDLYDRIVERAAAIPGVEQAAAVSVLPLEVGAYFIALSIEDHPVAPGAPAWTPDQRFVTPGYFDVMRIPILEGRGFTTRDTPAAPGAVIINATMARRYWPGRSAIGRRVKPVWQTQWRTIVGVVDDVRSRGLAEDVVDEIYLPYAQNPVPSMTIVARSALDPQQTANAIRTAAMAIDPQAPVSDVMPVTAVMAQAVDARRFLLRVLGAFATIALALGAVGIYGVTAYGVSGRRREIGLRLALGGTRRGVVGQLVRQHAVPIGAGLALGVAGAAASGRLLEGMLYRSSATDPAVLAAVVTLLGGTALAAAVIPAWRAVRGGAANALRQD